MIEKEKNTRKGTRDSPRGINIGKGKVLMGKVNEREGDDNDGAKVACNDVERQESEGKFRAERRQSPNQKKNLNLLDGGKENYT